MNANSWTITDGNGMSHTITCKVKSFGGPQITVDSNTYKVKSSNWLVNVIDYSVDFPGANCHVVMIGKNARLAVNGTYNDDGTAYEPVANVPKWVWVLVALSVIVGLVVGSWLFALIGIVFSTAYINSSLKKNNSKIIILFVIDMILCAIWLGVQFALAANGVI